MPNDKNAIRAAIQTLSGEMPENGWRIVWMNDTLGLEDFMISESLIEDAKRNPALSVGEERIVPEFNEQGNLNLNAKH